MTITITATHLIVGWAIICTFGLAVVGIVIRRTRANIAAELAMARLAVNNLQIRVAALEATFMRAAQALPKSQADAALDAAIDDCDAIGKPITRPSSSPRASASPRHAANGPVSSHP